MGSGVKNFCELKPLLSNALSLQCSDVFFYESVLRTNQFGYLPNLVNLDVEYCKVRRVPALAFSGLSGLRDLDVTTHNSDWSAMVLELEPGLVTNAISGSKNLWFA